MDTDPANAVYGLDLLPQDYAWATGIFHPIRSFVESFVAAVQMPLLLLAGCLMPSWCLFLKVVMAGSLSTEMDIALSHTTTWQIIACHIFVH